MRTRIALAFALGALVGTYAAVLRAQDGALASGVRRADPQVAAPGPGIERAISADSISRQAIADRFGVSKRTVLLALHCLGFGGDA